MADEQFPAAQSALEEYQDIERRMGTPEVAVDPDAMRKLGRKHAELGVIVSAYQRYRQIRDDLEAAKRWRLRTRNSPKKPGVCRFNCPMPKRGCARR
jgi:protein subunit release factor A